MMCSSDSSEPGAKPEGGQCPGAHSMGSQNKGTGKETGGGGAPALPCWGVEQEWQSSTLPASRAGHRNDR